MTAHPRQSNHDQTIKSITRNKIFSVSTKEERHSAAQSIVSCVSAVARSIERLVPYYGIPFGTLIRNSVYGMVVMLNSLRHTRDALDKKSDTKPFARSIVLRINVIAKILDALMQVSSSELRESLVPLYTDKLVHHLNGLLDIHDELVQWTTSAPLISTLLPKCGKVVQRKKLSPNQVYRNQVKQTSTRSRQINQEHRAAAGSI